LLEAWIVQKESNNVAVARTRMSSEGFHVPPGQRPKPAPASAQRSHGSCVDVIYNHLTREEAPRKNADHGR
jgi:hypothetical protein